MNTAQDGLEGACARLGGPPGSERVQLVCHLHAHQSCFYSVHLRVSFVLHRHRGAQEPQLVHGSHCWAMAILPILGAPHLGPLAVVWNLEWELPITIPGTAGQGRGTRTSSLRRRAPPWLDLALHVVPHSICSSRS